MHILTFLTAALVSTSTAVAADDPWTAVLERVASGVVSVEIDRTRAFDTTFYANSQATAFVVDAERGILLTNRHVVSPGPVVAEALFQGGEEVALTPLYRDPVHDFGFFAYDPAELEHVVPTELELAPAAAAVGLEIRVVGNDAGEKLSILAGTLARLDRPAPVYGLGTFNDFNTFYYQAASGTSGGSSGSPVLGPDGRVVALNAGANRSSASSFYLPLDRVVRALGYVQQGQRPPRGTLMTTFEHEPFDKLVQLGLSDATEDAVRAGNAQATGLLVVKSVLPGGVADGKLRVGDVVISLDGTPVRGFIDLEAVLDDGVGTTHTLEVERAGARQQVPLAVVDLHAITPSSFLELGGAVVHDLSYQLARGYFLPLRGVYLADDGYLFDRANIPARNVITAIDDVATPTLAALIEVVKALPEGHRARVRHFDPDEPERDRVSVLEMDRRWFPVRHCTLAQGPWPCVDLPGPGTREPVEGGEARFDDQVDKKALGVLRSLVGVSFDVPYTVEGVRGNAYVGQGLVLDAARGLVVTDRNTVPIPLGDVRLTIAGQVRIPAEVVALHPFHGLTLLRYDPSLLGSTPMASATLDPAPLEEGEAVRFVGRRGDGRPVVEDTTIARVDAVRAPIRARARFREANLDAAFLGSTPAGNGVLVNKKGRVRALWGSYSFDRGNSPDEAALGIPAWVLADLIAAYDAGQGMRSLEVELDTLSLTEARDLGMPDATVARLAAHDPLRRALRITRRTAGAPATEVLQDGDVLIAIDGALVTRFREVEEAAAAPEVTLTLLRAGEVMEVTTGTRAVSLTGLERVVVWAGAYLTDVPLAASALRLVPPEGVWVDLRWRGSPSARASLSQNARIVAVEGTATPDLDAFLRAVQGRPDRAPVRLDMIDLRGRHTLVTLKLDLDAFPTQELRRGPDGWRRTVLTDG